MLVSRSLFKEDFNMQAQTQWICIEQCYRFGLLWEIGDLAVSEQNIGPHFVPLEGLEGSIPMSGRKFLVENNRITGVWDGPE